MKNILTISLFFICAKSFATNDNLNTSTETIGTNLDISIGYNTDDEELDEHSPIYAPLSPQEQEAFFTRIIQEAIAQEYANHTAHTTNTIRYIANLRRYNREFRLRILSDFTMMEQARNQAQVNQQWGRMVYFIRTVLVQRYQDMLEFGLRGFPVETHRAIRNLFANDLDTGRETLDLDQDSLQRLFQNYYERFFLTLAIESLRRAGLPVTQLQETQITDRLINDLRTGREQITLDNTIERIVRRYYRDLQPVRSPVFFAGSGSFF